MLRTEVKMGNVERRIAGLARRLSDLTPVARDFGGHVVRRIRSSLKRLGPDQPSTPGEPPATRSGNRGLVGRITHNVLPGGEGVEIGTSERRDEVIHSGTRAALGGPIRPRKAKALTIPLNRAARGKRARDFDGLFVIKPNPGSPARDKGVLARAKGKDGVEPLFALRTAVDIEPRPFLEITDEDEAYLADAMEDALDKELGL